MARSLEMAGLRTFEYFSLSMALFEPVYSFEPAMTLERSILFAVVLIPASSTILQGGDICDIRHESILLHKAEISTTCYLCRAIDNLNAVKPTHCEVNTRMFLS